MSLRKIRRLECSAPALVMLNLTITTAIAFSVAHPVNLIQQAVTLTNLADRNVTAAYSACDLWKELYDSRVDLAIDSKVAALCWSLYASCLVRTGNDEEALLVYDAVADLRSSLDALTYEKIVVGKAKSLQRLLRYDEALDQFLLGGSCEEAVTGSVTCALRLGDIAQAIAHLENVLNSPRDSSEALAMLTALKYLRAPEKILLQDLKAASTLSPLYFWMYTIACSAFNVDSEDIDASSFSLRDFCSVNNGAFDSCQLIKLDDKVQLHKLLETSDHSSLFWPESYVLPRDAQKVRTLDSSRMSYILKRKSGYGSHGNTILSPSDALVMASRIDDEILLQRMVEPPLLLDGRKFSIRAYVLYFSPRSLAELPHVYMATNGLVKLAALPLNTVSHDQMDHRRHFTNSGRESNMLQFDFTYLMTSLSQTDVSYDYLMGQVEATIRMVMRLFSQNEKRESNADNGLGRLGIPKILGLDFVVNSQGAPFLIEVNRFPGLEPRDSSDERVKRQIIYDAWNKACVHSGVSRPIFANCTAFAGLDPLENTFKLLD